MLDLLPPPVLSAGVRQAGKGLLALALMEARNHSLRWLTAYEQWLEPLNFVVPPMPELTPPLWLLGHIGWYQERWVARNVQRHRGRRADPHAPRLASIEPDSDRWYDPANAPPDSRWLLDLPGVFNIKRYLADAIDITLELLERTPDSDDELYFFRLALFHEDLQAESLARMAQVLGLPSGQGLMTPGQPSLSSVRVSPRPQPALLPPLSFSGGTWLLGESPREGAAGFAFDNEQPAHEVRVEPFEMDAQPVCWSQYVQFVEDEGYQNPAWWTPLGWAWKEREARRAPRYTDKIQHGVLQRQFGRSTAVRMSAPVTHVSWFEAQAWCHWAGRRLPSETEWEMAACTGAERGFRWGEAWEWTCSTFAPYPGFASGPDVAYSQRGFGTHKVLRGASPATRARMRHPKFRHFELPQRDDAFCGFRSCAL